MAQVLGYILRFGPLVAAFALGLSALIEVYVPGFTGILNQILSGLGFFGIQPDQAVVSEVGNLVAGAIALVGVARKLWSLIQSTYFPTV